MIKNTAVLNWYYFLKIRHSILELVITIVVLIIALSVMTQFLLFVELREGVVLNDPILFNLPAVDFTWITFLLIYGGLLLALIFLSMNPNLLIIALQSYIIMVCFRMLMMYLLPLNPPEGLLPLNDPVIEMFGTGQLLYKDLFFSGHTATMFLFYLTTDQKYLKIFFLSAAIIIAILLILQHVHYAIDVAAAPFFAYCSYRIALSLHKRLMSAERNK